MKLMTVHPSRRQCSSLMPALPSANTINDIALSNQRLALSPCSSWSHASTAVVGLYVVQAQAE